MQGRAFFKHDEYLKLKKALPEYVKGLVTFAYKIGWRFSEISGLTWDQVDLKRGVVSLNPGETKNGAGRTIVLDAELKKVIKQQRELRVKTGMRFKHVFLNSFKPAKLTASTMHGMGH